ncbi:MAG TPA: hypothetical protein VNJ51_01960 [Candidatus Dormibacteraeota bacterium]|nr:hypothetical protein [Candidatus Dormibacteraeota bacterium]
MKRPIFAAVLAGVLTLGAVAGASASSLLGKLLLGAGGVLLVKATAVPLNNFINNLMASNHVANRDHTKVVPILTVGSNLYVGAAQVSGPTYDVNRVQAVGAFKADWNNGVWNVDALVPIDNLNVLRGFHRVYGTGIDAVLDAKL